MEEFWGKKSTLALLRFCPWFYALRAPLYKYPSSSYWYAFTLAGSVYSASIDLSVKTWCSWQIFIPLFFSLLLFFSSQHDSKVNAPLLCKTYRCLEMTKFKCTVKIEIIAEVTWPNEHGRWQLLLTIRKNAWQPRPSVYECVHVVS